MIFLFLGLGGKARALQFAVGLPVLLPMEWLMHVR